MTRKLVILLTSIALGGVASAAPGAAPDRDDDDNDTSADPAEPDQPAQPPQSSGPSQAPAPHGQARLGIAVTDSDAITRTSGAMVSDVMPDSAAARAGIQTGDLIIAIDGAPVTRADGVVNAISSRRPTDAVSVTVMRNGQRLELRATLEADRGRRAPHNGFPPRWNRFMQPPMRDFSQPSGPSRIPGMRGTPFGGELQLRRQLDDANRRIDELERRIEQLEHR